MKVLVVEDDATQRLYLKHFFGKYGTCEAVENGREAEALFRGALEGNEPFHLVCLDILLPDLSGQELLKQFRALEQQAGIPFHNRCRILMVTALKDMMHITKAFASDCDGYLVKPVKPDTLKEKIESLGLLSS